MSYNLSFYPYKEGEVVFKETYDEDWKKNLWFCDIKDVLLGIIINYNTLVLNKISVPEDAEVVEIDGISTTNKFVIEESRKVTLKQLIEMGADIDTGEGYLLNFHAISGEWEKMREVLELGANPNTKEKTALKYACFYAKLEIVKLMIKNGIEIDENYHKAVQMCANNYFYPEMLDLLIDNGVKDEYTLNYILSKGISKRDTEIMLYAIDKGANVNNEKGSPIRCAIIRGFYELVPFLVKRGADLDIHDGVLLKGAIMFRNYISASFLIESGAKVTENIFDFAIESRNSSAFIELFVDKSDIKVDENHLLLAERNNNTEVIEYFINLGIPTGKLKTSTIMQIIMRDSSASDILAKNHKCINLWCRLITMCHRK